MRLKRETQGAFCVLNANAKSQTRKSMKINVICSVYTNIAFLSGVIVIQLANMIIYIFDNGGGHFACFSTPQKNTQGCQ